MAGHRGVNATQALVADRFYWKRLHRQVADWVYGCSVCRRAKIDRSKRQGELNPVEVPNRPGHSYNMDIIVDLPEVQWRGEFVSKVLVVVDRFTKRTILLTLPRNANAEQVVNAFVTHVCCECGLGLPQVLVLDRDPLFSSTYIRSFAQRLGIHLAIASARSQQTNGLAERTIATVEEVLRTRIDLRQQTWPALLPELVFSLNNQPLELFNGKSSLFCEKGVRPLVPVDVMEQLQRADRKNAVVQPVQDKKEALAAERIKTMVETRKQMTEEIHKSQQSFSKHYDKTKRVVDEALKPGAKVWLRFEGFELDGLKLKGTKEKLRPRFVGPFLVVEQISPVSFRIKLPQSKIDSGLHDVFHVRNLLVDKPNAKSILPPEKFESTLNEQEYEMHSVITHDKHGKQNRFLIRWKNWPEALATWISEAVFRADAPDMLAEYMKAHNIATDGQVLEDEPVSKRAKKRNSATNKQKRKARKAKKKSTDASDSAPAKVVNSRQVPKGPSTAKKPIRKSGRLRPYSTRNAGLVLMELMRKDAKQHTEEACLQCGS